MTGYPLPGLVFNLLVFLPSQPLAIALEKPESFVDATSSTSF
jgi:hypothetical protein